MKRLALFLLLASIVVPTGLALRAQEAPGGKEGTTGESLEDLIQDLRNKLNAADGSGDRREIRFVLRLYDIRDLTYPIKDYPGGDINLTPSGGFGFGVSGEEEFEPMPSYAYIEPERPTYERCSKTDS